MRRVTVLLKTLLTYRFRRITLPTYVAQIINFRPITYWLSIYLCDCQAPSTKSWYVTFSWRDAGMWKFWCFFFFPPSQQRMYLNCASYSASVFPHKKLRARTLWNYKLVVNYVPRALETKKLRIDILMYHDHTKRVTWERSPRTGAGHAAWKITGH